jgi:hypothetical protein
VPQETITNWTTRERLEVCTNREEDDDNDEEEEAEVDQGLQSRTLLITRSPVAEIPDWLEQKRRWATGWEEPSVNAIRIHPVLWSVHEKWAKIKSALIFPHFPAMSVKSSNNNSNRAQATNSRRLAPAEALKCDGH